jgi:hypothetical protein
MRGTLYRLPLLPLKLPVLYKLPLLLPGTLWLLSSWVLKMLPVALLLQIWLASNVPGTAAGLLAGYMSAAVFLATLLSKD